MRRRLVLRGLLMERVGLSTRGVAPEDWQRTAAAHSTTKVKDAFIECIRMTRWF